MTIQTLFIFSNSFSYLLYAALFFCNFLLNHFVFFVVDASQAGAGNLEIIVSVNGRNVPNYVQSEGNAKFRVNFKPMEASVYTICVKFNGELVPGKNTMAIIF